MDNFKVVEHIPKPRIHNKCQVQIKNGNYSKSFTVYGMDIDYLFEQFFTITKKIAESPIDGIKVICYKPPK